ncbi:unnamed protein product, partial [Rotaria sp. Silwood1]
MNDLDKAEEFYTLLLNELPSDHSDVITIKNDLGGIYRENGEYLQALQNHKEALKLHRLIMPHDFVQRAAIYNDIGYVYEELEISPELADTYNNIGEVYLSMQNIETARVYFEKSLEIRLKSLPSDHRSLATSYSNLGQVYDYSNDHQKGLEYHQKSLNILLKCLPPNHIDLAAVYNNIGASFSDLGDFTSALINQKKALRIKCNLLSSPRVQ